MNMKWVNVLWVASALGLMACGGRPFDPGGDPGTPGGTTGRVAVSVEGLVRGEVRMEGGGFTCADALCLLERPAGTTVTLTATPPQGTVFTGWSGECTGTGPCQLELRSDAHKVRAGFGLPNAWSRAIGSTGGDLAYAVTRGTDGSITLAGHLGASTTVDGQTLQAGPFLARFDSTGQLLWSRPLPALGSTVRLRLLDNGELLLAGTFHGTVQLGAQSLTSAGAGDVLIARLSASGEPLWAKPLGGSGEELALLLEVDSSGNVHVGGDTAGFQPEGASAPVYNGGFIVTLGSDGAFRSIQATNPGPTLRGFDGQGRHILVGDDGSTFTLYAACTHSDGSYAWGYEPLSPSAASVSPQTLLVRPDDSVLLAGTFSGYMADVMTGRSGGQDIFLLHLSSAGQVLWGKRLGGPDIDVLGGMAPDAEGNLLLAGYTDGSSVDLGAGNWNPGTGVGYQALLARYSPTGAHLWSTTFGGTGTEKALAVASGGGEVIVAGEFEGTTHFGDAQRTSAGHQDIFLFSLR
jgi:hypothetical protein